MKILLIVLLSTQALLLADLPLAELATKEPGFAKAYEASHSGDAATARKELLAATEAPETRVRLLAWNALRQLGVQPDAEEAWIIRGVVVESPEGAVAVYEDGRIRWNGGVLDSPGANKELARLAKTMLTAAEPAMKSTRPMPRSDATPVAKDRVRLTVLTYGGFYVIDAHRPSMTEEHPVSAPVLASKELLRLLDETR